MKKYQIFTEELLLGKKRFQNFSFLGLKNLPPCQFWGDPTDEDVIEFQKFLLQFKNQVWEQNCV